MRKIKFRAWDKHKSEMLYQSAEIDTNTEGPYFLMEGSILAVHVTEGGCSMQDVSDQFHITEFTGRHDINGKEIWEGDILKVTLNTRHYGKGNRKKQFYMLVEWNDSEGAFTLVWPANTWPFHIMNNSWEFCEIAGNIFENSELLNKASVRAQPTKTDL